MDEGRLYLSHNSPMKLIEKSLFFQALTCTISSSSLNCRERNYFGEDEVLGFLLYSMESDLTRKI